MGGGRVGVVVVAIEVVLVPVRVGLSNIMRERFGLLILILLLLLLLLLEVCC